MACVQCLRRHSPPALIARPVFLRWEIGEYARDGEVNMRIKSPTPLFIAPSPHAIQGEKWRAEGEGRGEREREETNSGISKCSTSGVSQSEYKYFSLEGTHCTGQKSGSSVIELYWSTSEMDGQPVCMDILSSASLALNETSGSASAVASSSSFNIRRGTCFSIYSGDSLQFKQHI